LFIAKAEGGAWRFSDGSECSERSLAIGGSAATATTNATEIFPMACRRRSLDIVPEDKRRRKKPDPSDKTALWRAAQRGRIAARGCSAGSSCLHPARTESRSELLSPVWRGRGAVDLLSLSGDDRARHGRGRGLQFHPPTLLTNWGSRKRRSPATAFAALPAGMLGLSGGPQPLPMPRLSSERKDCLAQRLILRRRLDR